MTSMSHAPTVHVVDDDEAVRGAIQFCLGLAGFSVATFDGAGALLGTVLPPEGCILTDYHMPGLNGLQLQQRLSENSVFLPVIVMTGHADVPLAVRALKAGAVDFLEKPFTDDQLVVAVQTALDRNAKAVQGSAVASLAAQKIALLTPREREVLDFLAAGKSTKDIARALGTSPRTIDVHRARVLHKLEANSLAEIVHLVIAGTRNVVGR
jgi:two-component system response regulator FixJ